MGQSYQDLIAWQKAMEFVMDIYRNTKNFPRDEVYGLAAQLGPSSVSIPANIAEGQARYSAVEFHNFLGRARGALVEVETEIILAQNLEFLTKEQGNKLLSKAAELRKILNGLAGAISPAA
jgi:four helix bundle protein